MRVLIDSGSYHCLNLGDVAMLQAAIERLRRLWPNATLGAVTNAPAALLRHCPGVRPIPLSGRVAFFSDRFFGRADRFLARAASDLLEDVERRVRERWPVGLSALITAKRALTLRPDYAAPRAYVEALRRADLVVATGAGVLADPFLENALGVLTTLALAQRWNIATALMGQGIGPAANESLRRGLASVLPRAGLIAVRERRESLPLLASLDVPSDRIVVTGDDAVEMANRRAPRHLGAAIGVNVRVARYAEVDAKAGEAIRPTIHRVATRLSAALQPLPIAHHPDCHDGMAIGAIVSGYRGADGAIAELDTPLQAIDAVSRCRVVVTGSYHAAVFALAQGIPVVAIARSPYYLSKFSGLAELFPGGCTIVPIDEPDAAGRLEGVITSAWRDAPQRRESLLRAAAAQVAQGRAAYRRLTAFTSSPFMSAVAT